MKFIILVMICCIFSCSASHQFQKDKSLFDASGTLMSFKSVADMNDSYFVVKENNFFEFYRQLFDSVKNSSYPGKFTRNGDTLLLSFYDKKGYHLLGRKALVSNDKKEIVFFK